MRIMKQLKIKERLQRFRQIRGFTVLETLLVLTITCSFIILFETSFRQTVHLIRGELFVLEFENKLKHQQSQALTRAEVRTISATDNVISLNGELLIVPLETIFSDFNITFKANGNIQSIKRAKIVVQLPYHNNKTITYQLQLGSGLYKKTTS